MNTQPKHSIRAITMAVAVGPQPENTLLRIAPLVVVADSDGEAVKRLPLSFSKQGFTFEQVIRNGWKALYRQKLNGLTVGFEYFYIRIQPGKVYMGSIFKTKERFPHNEAFGKWAWSIRGRDEKEALNRFLNLKKPTSR